MATLDGLWLWYTPAHPSRPEKAHFFVPGALVSVCRNAERTKAGEERQDRLCQQCHAIVERRRSSPATGCPCCGRWSAKLGIRCAVRRYLCGNCDQPGHNAQTCRAPVNR